MTEELFERAVGYGDDRKSQQAEYIETRKAKVQADKDALKLLDAIGAPYLIAKDTVQSEHFTDISGTTWTIAVAEADRKRLTNISFTEYDGSRKGVYVRQLNDTEIKTAKEKIKTMRLVLDAKSQKIWEPADVDFKEYLKTI